MNQKHPQCENDLNYAGPARDKAQTVVNDLVTLHERELAGWNWLQLAMAKEPPDAQEEAALYEILSRARREFRN